MFWTYRVYGVDLLPPLLLFPLHPMLVQVIEQLVYITRSYSILVPLLGIELEQIEIRQLLGFLSSSQLITTLTSKSRSLLAFRGNALTDRNAIFCRALTLADLLHLGRRRQNGQRLVDWRCRSRICRCIGGCSRNMTFRG
jgi:hypothetical protein